MSGIKNKQNIPDTALPDKAKLAPTPVKNFDFPVEASFINLTQLYMHMIHWQWHEEVEFVIVNNGHALLRLTEESLLLSPGEGVFLNQNQIHSLQAADKEDCSIYTLNFHPAFLFGYGQTYFSTKYLTPVLSAPYLGHLLLKENTNTGTLIDIVNDILACCLAKRYGYELKVKSLLCNLWFELLQYTKAAEENTVSPSSQSVSDSERIKQAITFIERNHMEPISLEDIASSIHISKSECCRCFQRALGITPFEYLIKYRIFESTRKMMSGDEAAQSISTLAVAVGFNSASYYNKLFKKYLNCTPSEYKRALKKTGNRNPEAYL